MSLIADIMLLIAALAAAFYCRVLAVRLRRLGQTDQGLGGAISALNFQVEEMKSALKEVSANAEQRSYDLTQLTVKAEASARRLEILLASLHETQEQQNYPKRSGAMRDVSADGRAALQAERDQEATRSKQQSSRIIARRRNLAKPEFTG